MAKSTTSIKSTKMASSPQKRVSEANVSPYPPRQLQKGSEEGLVKLDGTESLLGDLHNELNVLARAQTALRDQLRQILRSSPSDETDADYKMEASGANSPINYELMSIIQGVRTRTAEINSMIDDCML